MSELGKPYRPSGERAWALLPMALVGAVAGACAAPALKALVAWMYGTASAKITGFKKFKGWGLLLVFVWFLGAGLAGLVVGGAAGFVGRLLRCRSGAESRSGALLSVVLAGVGLYAYYLLWTLEGLGEADLRWVSPGEVWGFLQTYLSDRAASGKAMAYFAYAVEAAAYWAGVVAGLEHFLEHPYCEACGRWADHEEGFAWLECPEAESLAILDGELRAGNLAVLAPLGPATEAHKEAIRIDVSRCGGCEGGRWASFKQDSHPGFEEPEAGALEAMIQLKKLASAKGVAKQLKKGAEAEFDRTVEVKRLRVDAAFLGRLCEAPASES